MSATSQQLITIRNDNLFDIAVMRGSAISGGTYYHGTYVVLDYDGYWKNFTSAIKGIKGIGILKSMKFEEQANSAIVTIGTMTATGNGDLVNNTNCFDIYVKGEFDGVFESAVGITKADEGRTVYVVDNNTLTVSPSLGLYPIGRLTKYKSATTGSIDLDGIPGQVNDGTRIIRGSIGSAATTSSGFGEGFLLASILNPYGVNMMITDFALGIKTASTGTGSAGTTPTSTASALTEIVMSTGGFSIASSGIWQPSNDLVSDSTLGSTATGQVPRIWGSTYTFVITATSSAPTLAGWYEIKVRAY